MKNRIIYSIILLFPLTSFSQSMEKAILLNEHGLIDKAKSEAINLITSSQNPETKANAYFLLAQIAVNNDDLGLALKTLEVLIDKYPKSNYAKRAQSIRSSLVGTLSGVRSNKIDNLTAKTYISNGDLFSSGKSNRWAIDTSFIPPVEAAIKWYDRVIEEFPNSEASKLAYERKIQTLLGWEDPGRYGEKHGIKGNFEKYMLLLLDTGRKYFEEHPDTEFKHAFRYQIAQAFWRQKDWETAETWLNTIIEKSDGEDSFYSDLAKRRLENLKY